MFWESIADGINDGNAFGVIGVVLMSLGAPALVAALQSVWLRRQRAFYGKGWLVGQYVAVWIAALFGTHLWDLWELRLPSMGTMVIYYGGVLLTGILYLVAFAVCMSKSQKINLQPILIVLSALHFCVNGLYGLDYELFHTGTCYFLIPVGLNVAYAGFALVAYRCRKKAVA